MNKTDLAQRTANLQVVRFLKNVPLAHFLKWVPALAGTTVVAAVKCAISGRNVGIRRIKLNGWHI